MKERFTSKMILRTFLYFLYLFVIVLLLAEVAYRSQWIDFYRNELQASNKNEKLAEDNKPTILAFGDSFTVQETSWLNQIRNDLPEYRVINTAITGSSVIETSYIASGRIKNFDPDIVIYQIYVGNDLIGIRHFLNWKEWSPQRNIYWWLSDYFHVIAYFNYKLGQTNWRSATSGNKVTSLPSTDEKFDADSYREREKMLATGDPQLVSNSALLRNKRDEDMKDLSSKLKEIISLVKPNCKIYLLVIPHKAQINSYYQSNMQAIGFQFDRSFQPGEENYPFIEKLKTDFHDHLSVEIINPLISLQQKDSPIERMFYLQDEHLSWAGQKVVKDLVLETIK